MEATSLTVASKTCLGVNLRKEMEDLYNENFTKPKKEIEGVIILIHLARFYRSLSRV